ncbi:hypothetical protein FQN54_002733 [Arachnomyces sp. PD_36]|nr:hypothetical protein FQN54_002733 [Arachnomyces sp. PD_36]
MSFGFSVGDFVTLSSFAWKVYNTCKNSSNEFNFLTREINSLRIVLERTAECLAEHSPNANTAAEFHQLRSDYQEVLSHIDALLDKHRHLGKRRKRRLWDAVRWALEDTASIKESLLLYTSMLTALNTNLIK